MRKLAAALGVILLAGSLSACDTIRYSVEDQSVPVAFSSTAKKGQTTRELTAEHRSFWGILGFINWNSFVPLLGPTGLSGLTNDVKPGKSQISNVVIEEQYSTTDFGIRVATDVLAGLVDGILRPSGASSSLPVGGPVSGAVGTLFTDSRTSTITAKVSEE